MTKPEKLLETQILTWLNSIYGCYAIKNETTGVYDPSRGVFRTIKNPYKPKGVSDIIGLHRGHFFAIEVKAGYNKPTIEQKDFLKNVEKCGGVAFWTNDFDQCRELFMEFFSREDLKSGNGRVNSGEKKKGKTKEHT